MKIFCKKIIKKNRELGPLVYLFAGNCRTNLLKVYSKDSGEYLLFKNVYKCTKMALCVVCS